MSSLISKERRILWKRRVKGFWEEFRRKKIGMVGLFILVFFVTMAIFAPWLSPYDPLAPKRVADGFAMPQWVTVFPQFKDLPSTHRMTLYWEKEAGSDFIKGWGNKVVVQFEAVTTETVYAELSAKIFYPEIMSPNAFFCDFTWSAEGIKDLQYLLKLIVVNPKGNETLLWLPEGWQTVGKGEIVHVDSVNPFLLKRLGLKLGSDNLANIVFSEKGEYNFLMQVVLKPQTEDAEGKITFQDANVVTLGQVHGILGCDNAGADLWAQLVWGARVSLMIGLMAAGIATSIGILVGIVAGYLGGATDEVLMRIVDILLALPLLPLLLTLVALFGKNILYIVLFVAIFGWQGLSRIVRSHVLSLRETSFIECA